MYAVPAVMLTVKQINELDICWNFVIWKLFTYKKWESVKGVLHGLGLLNILHLIMLGKVKFYKHMFLSANSVLCNVLCYVITPVTICYALHSYHNVWQLIQYIAYLITMWVSIFVVSFFSFLYCSALFK